MLRGAAPAKSRLIQLKGFNLGGPTSLQCRIHPVVVFTILDSYVRRSEGAERTIGTLLGTVTEGNVVEVTDCFPVVHQDRNDEQCAVLMDQDYHRQMLALRQKVSQKEQVIGWFATGPLVESSCVIHQFYCTKESLFQPQSHLHTPIHMTLDTSLQNLKLGVKCYVFCSTPIADSLAQFHEIPFEMMTLNAEKTGMAMLLRARQVQKEMQSGESNPRDVQAAQNGFKDALKKLLEQFKKCHEYVDKVLKGEIPGDPSVGRYLTKTLRSSPHFDVEQFERLCGNTLQDTLMVVYLSNLTRTQIALTEKINATYSF